jgi:hypothetical protein
MHQWIVATVVDGRRQNLASSHGWPSDHALLVSQDGVVDHAGDGAHGRPQDGVVMQALHRDPPELQGTQQPRCRLGCLALC